MSILVEGGGQGATTSEHLSKSYDSLQYQRVHQIVFETIILF